LHVVGDEMAVKDLLEAVSILNSRFQTTIPPTVRKALDLDQGDILHYEILETGDVILSKKVHALEHDDPVIKQFLFFLDKDIHHHPEHVKPLSEARMARISELTKDVQYDINAPLPEDDD
jgi:antitoxin PrlF